MSGQHASPAPTVRHVLAVVSQVFGAPLCDLLSERSARDISVPRQAAMALAREMTPHSLPTIGRALRRDHTTVMHGIRAHQRRLDSDRDYAARVARARDILNPESTHDEG